MQYCIDYPIDQLSVRQTDTILGHEFARLRERVGCSSSYFPKKLETFFGKPRTPQVVQY